MRHDGVVYAAHPELKTVLQARKPLNRAVRDNRHLPWLRGSPAREISGHPHEISPAYPEQREISLRRQDVDPRPKPDISGSPFRMGAGAALPVRFLRPTAVIGGGSLRLILYTIYLRSPHEVLYTLFLRSPRNRQLKVER